MEYEEARKQVIEACLGMQKKGLIRGTSGNVSVRIRKYEDAEPDPRWAEEDLLAISPTSIPYEELTPEMIPIVDMQGRTVHEGTDTAADEKGREPFSCRPSSELPLHLAVMRARADAGAVVHTHSKFATIMGILGQKVPVNTITMVYYVKRPVPVVPFEIPGSEELGAAVTRALNGSSLDEKFTAAPRKAVILEHHGLVTLGKDIDDALTVAEYVEEAAEIAYYVSLADSADYGRHGLLSLTGSVSGSIPDSKVKKMLEIADSGRAL
ncbi:MAG: class II aldolase/adducin family protein [Firmicutes bacterium]|nr:class II aldolase/adducin family protein [Bacillota bacterium]